MAPRSDDIVVGDEIPSLARVIVREEVKAYADASGDQNPLHQDDEVARAAGFDGIIGHGMLTMGHLGTCVTNWAGDASAIVRFKVQFRAPVFMGDTIVAGGRVRAIDAASGTASLDLWVSVERGGVTEYPIKRGEAVVRLT